MLDKDFLLSTAGQDRMISQINSRPNLKKQTTISLHFSRAMNLKLSLTIFSIVLLFRGVSGRLGREQEVSTKDTATKQLSQAFLTYRIHLFFLLIPGGDCIEHDETS